jgi:hypothetical protein
MTAKLQLPKVDLMSPCEGLKPDLSVDQSDPRNVRYLKALDRKEDEDIARSMADAIYPAMLDDLDSDEITTEQDVMIYCQCLVDARRMLLDPEYNALFE